MPSLSVRRAALAAAALALAGCAGSGGGRPGPGSPGGVTYIGGATPQLHLERDGRHVVLTVLRDDLVHLAYRQTPPGNEPYRTPMVSEQRFEGPDEHRWDADARRLTTRALSVELDQDCWRVSDLSAGAPRVLTRLCVDRWSTDGLRLGWSSEGHSDVLGLGQFLSSGRDTPSWVGHRRSPGNELGNAMTYSDIAASGDTQVPVAYVLGEGTQGYGVFFDTPYALGFDFTGRDWRVDAGRDALGLFLFTGNDLKDLRRDYLTLTGRPPVPPLKAFGLWISEYGYDDWAELDGKLNTLRANGFPIDGAVLDLQWYGGILSGSRDTPMGGLSWDTRRFPDPAAKLSAYAADGLGLMLIEQSYIGGNRPEFRQLAERRHLAMRCAPPCTDAAVLSRNPWWGVGGMIDWSNAEAGRGWHDGKRRALIDDGVLGHWTDLGEPEIYDAAAHYHGLDWYGERRGRHADVHNLYNLFWSRSLAEETARTHPARRPWILSRSGTAGSQRYGVAMWSGDVASSFDALGAQMAAQANMSLSGFDYYGSDVGGFQRRGIGEDEFRTLYTRWFATSALLDVPLRPHVQNLCNCTETAPDRAGDRASNLDALRLRYRLTPYLYSLAHEAHAGGEPVFPPLSYHFQADRQARTQADSKMIGPWLLFGALRGPENEIDVYLPRGAWTDFRHPERTVESAGGLRRQTVLDAGLVRAPLYLREGAIVPTLREAPLHLGQPRARGVQWFADLLLRTRPAAAETRFVLYEDDGVSRAYETGKVARTAIVARKTGDGGFSLELTPDNRTGETARRRLTVEVLTGGAGVSAVTVDGEALPPVAAESTGRGWYASPGGVTLRLGELSVDQPLRIRLLP